MSRMPTLWRIAIINKLVFWAVMFVGLCASSFSTGRLATGDAEAYLTLSSQGYQNDSPLCAFYPLWPGLIAVSKSVFGSSLTAGLVLSNGLSLLAMWLFHGLVKRSSGEQMANDALILMLAFPGALFFSVPYSESLFLVLVLAMFRGFELRNYWLVCFTTFLLPLTRAVGILVLLPLAWHLVHERKALRYWLTALSPLAGYSTYFIIMRLCTGNALEGFQAQQVFPNSPSLGNMFDLPGLLRALGRINTLDGMVDGVLDRVFFVILLAMLPVIYRTNRTWFFYTLPIGLIPALTAWFSSYRRYCMVCFPVFIVLTQLLRKPGRRILFWYFVILLSSLQVWAVIKFVNFGWAG